MTGLDAWKFSDAELTAIIHALDEVERTKYGQRILDELLQSAAARQRKQAQDEDWHISHEPPNPPNWETTS